MNFWRALFAFLLCLVLPLPAAAIEPPRFERYITDLTGTLTHEQAQRLEMQLSDFASRHGSQIAVLIVPSTAPEAIEQFSIRVVDQWKLGRRGVDDGALLLVAKNDRNMRIEVGYGLEGALTDAVSKRIIAEIIAPRFKQGDFFGGIQDGVNAISKVVLGENLPAPKIGGARAQDRGGAAFPILIFGVILGGILRSIFGKGLGAGLGGLAAFVAGSIFLSGFVAVLIALVVVFLVFAGNRMPMAGSSYGRYSSRGGTFRSSGGFGGGGFGGGGGGSFGGGGASGKW